MERHAVLYVLACLVFPQGDWGAITRLASVELLIMSYQVWGISPIWRQPPVRSNVLLVEIRGVRKATELLLHRLGQHWRLLASALHMEDEKNADLPD